MLNKFNKTKYETVFILRKCKIKLFTKFVVYLDKD